MDLLNKIQNGIVMDHIKAGLGIKLYDYLGFKDAPFTVALITNAASGKLGLKDIIKIENIVDIDYTALGLIDDNITVSIIKNGEIASKAKLSLPQRVQDVIRCKNPRCITSIEKHIPHIFILKDEGKKRYGCAYCEETVENFQL